MFAADRLAQRSEKQAKKALDFKPPAVPEWVAIDGMWPAYAVDGRGHHDGRYVYVCQIPVKDFGEHLFLGGEARITLSTQQVSRPPTRSRRRPPPGCRADLPAAPACTRL